MRAANRHAKEGEKKAGDPRSRFEADALALAEKVARKKKLEEDAAAGLVTAGESKRGPGGAVKKKDGSKPPKKFDIADSK